MKEEELKKLLELCLQDHKDFKRQIRVLAKEIVLLKRKCEKCST
jgi:hypothetical protein